MFWISYTYWNQMTSRTKKQYQQLWRLWSSKDVRNFCLQSKMETNSTKSRTKREEKIVIIIIIANNATQQKRRQEWEKIKLEYE